MRLQDYPVKFDGTAIPFTETWEEISEVVENVGTAEDGSDIVQIKRTDKLTVSVSLIVDSTWMDFFYDYAKNASLINVSIFDSEVGAYVIRRMRLRSFKKNKITYSELVRQTMGLWNVSFNLIETEF